MSVSEIKVRLSESTGCQMGTFEIKTQPAESSRMSSILKEQDARV
jgi:hypothetical protein